MDAAKLKSELFIAFEELTAFIRRTLNMLRVREDHLRRIFRQGHSTIARLGSRVASQPGQLQKALRAREDGLRLLLTSSRDPIVVINGERRFVDANPKALDLFGISETNMRKFTVDAFISHGQIIKFDGNGSAFIKRSEKHGKCEIRRLDGSLRLAEFTYIANFVPFRHLYRFRGVSATNQYRPVTLRTLTKPSFAQPKT